MTLGPEQLRRRRASAQLLGAGAYLSPVQVVRHLLAVPAQDLRSVRLALRARSAGLRLQDVDRALTHDQSLVVSWLGRGKLNMVAREDYPWLWALTAPTRAASSRRRLAQAGVCAADAERAVAVIERSLAEQGPLVRSELATHLAAAGLRTQGQALPQILMHAALHGTVVLGPLRDDGQQAFVRTRDWLGRVPAPLDESARAASLGRLVQRYLRGHGPATLQDLASWSGLPARDVRTGIRVAGREVAGVSADLFDLAARPPGLPPTPPRLLPAFDPYLLGWHDRTFAVPIEHLRRVHPGGGALRAAALLHGAAVGTWAARRHPGGARIEVAPFDGVDAAVTSAFAAEAADLARFVGWPDEGASLVRAAAG